MNRRVLLLIAAWFFSGTLAPAQDQGQRYEFGLGPDRFVLLVPDGYFWAYTADEDILLMEFIPEGEDIDHWTSIYTLVLTGGPQKPVTQMRETYQKNFFQACQSGAGRKANFDLYQQGGHDVAEWVEFCDMTIAGPSKGHPEVDIFKISNGSNAFAAVSFAFRYIPSDAEISKWRKFLATVGWK